MLSALLFVTLVGFARAGMPGPYAPRQLPESPRKLILPGCYVKCYSSVDFKDWYKFEWSFKPTIECWKCIDEHALTQFLQIPVSAVTDLLQAKLGTGYTEMWCAKNGKNAKGEGVDIKTYPGGWMPDPKNRSKFTGCETTTNFPGLQTTSHQSHAYVKKEMATLPALQNSGKVWRGNELGFIISNEKFWSNTAPRSVLLGSTVNQHKVVRPILERLYGSCNAACQKNLKVSAKVVQDQDLLAVQDDVKGWIFEQLFEITFPGETNPVVTKDFVALQSSFTTLSTITQMVPDGLSDAIAKSTIEGLNNLFTKLKPLTEKIYGDELKGKNCECPDSIENCPSKTCVDVLTSAFMDTLLAAGGLSVPGAISTGIWVLHADTSNHEFEKDLFPETRVELTETDVDAFFYESMRFFAPVVGFPWWTQKPDRATDDKADQYDNGVRKVLNLALANKDPNAWGKDCHKFRVKTLSDYRKLFLGFADFAYDDTVADGNMDRKCPGKTLAFAMGRAWFEQWNQKAWCYDSDQKSQYKEATPFVDDFVLRKNGGWATDEECSDPSAAGTTRPALATLAAGLIIAVASTVS